MEVCGFLCFINDGFFSLQLFFSINKQQKVRPSVLHLLSRKVGVSTKLSIWEVLKNMDFKIDILKYSGYLKLKRLVIVFGRVYSIGTSFPNF